MSTMFDKKEITPEPEAPKPVSENPGKYKNIINSLTTISSEDNYNAVDQMLEFEKQYNKTEPWNKLDKTAKIQRLHQYAEKYGKEHSLPVKDIKSLKLFFITSLEKNKLQKAKDVVYDKENSTITSIPALCFNQTARNFTLKILDAKRVSTLKSLTPKRVTEKSREEDKSTD